MLTSTYAALYKTTSPLTLDWRSKEVAQMMGNDPQLIRLFCNIKTEMFWFRGCSLSPEMKKSQLISSCRSMHTPLISRRHTIQTAHPRQRKQTACSTYKGSKKRRNYMNEAFLGYQISNSSHAVQDTRSRHQRQADQRSFQGIQ
jgi:hypothetical protein